MRVVIGEAVVRISHWYIACYRRSDSEDGTKRSELEETTMGDGGGSILFFLRRLFRATLHYLNTWITLTRGAKSGGKVLPTSFSVVICFRFFFLMPSFLLSLTVKTKNPIMESKLYETTSDDNQRNLYVIQ